MNVKDFVQLLVPPIYYKVKKRIFPPQQPVVNPLPKVEHKGDRMIIIGNGPSLNKSMELYGEEIKHSDSIMVNFAAQAELFSVIKPSIYLLVDPAWFNQQNHIIESINACIKTIVKKTNWSMTIVMPHSAKGSIVIEPFKTNRNLQLQFFEDCHNMPPNMTQYEAWDKNMVCPPGQTVLNTAVWLSIYLGYKETYLIGADTSFLADLKVDQETNGLYTVDTHFYNNKSVYGDFYDEKKNRRPINSRLHEELFSIGTALRDYWDMREYADWKGVKVYNASEYSWIDAFERKKLN